MLKDQRTMTGTTPLATKEEILATWQAYVSHPLFQSFVTGRTSRDLIESNEVVEAYVSAGRWVADCPTSLCNGGIACWPEHKLACCLDCGTIYFVKYPHKDMIEKAEAILSQRPEENQNWRPDRGEKIQMLAAENITAQLDVVVPAEVIV